MPASLRDLERTLSVLWTSEIHRSNFLKNGSLPTDEFAQSMTSEIDERGVRTYAELIKIGRSDLMLSVYPGCARLLNKKWQETIDDYFETCPPKHYHLNMAASSFSEYLIEHCPQHLQLMEDAQQIKVLPHTPLTEPVHFEKFAPVVNPVLTIRNYNYPVPVIVDYLREGQLPRNISPREVSVAVYRDPETHLGRYVEITPGIVQLITEAQTQPTVYADLAATAIAYSQAGSAENALLEFFEAVEKLQSLNIFVGNILIGSQTV
ncbi:MAG: putative DNA-binding domain-containing protein [Candidatus Obscuribacterales bacterium]|nr:putative DNA-binding domain-containing protein [Candidatus Obscuribacterales bacterium]